MCIYIYTCTRLIEKPITTKENEVEKERRILATVIVTPNLNSIKPTVISFFLL